MDSHLEINPGSCFPTFSKKTEIFGSIKGSKNRSVIKLNRFITTTYALNEGNVINEVVGKRRNDAYIRVCIKNRDASRKLRNSRIVSRGNQLVSSSLLEAFMAVVGGNQTADRSSAYSSYQRRNAC